MTRRCVRTPVACALTLAATALAACAGDPRPAGVPSASTTSTRAATGDISLADLPDPCTLVSRATLDDALYEPGDGTRNAPATDDGEQLLFRTCTWGDVDDPVTGAIGVQIGTPTVSGHDVVANRANALDPALATDIGTDGKETMLLGAMPTGGAKGSTIFFRHDGWSVMIGHIGRDARLATVEALAREVIAALDELAADEP